MNVHPEFETRLEACLAALTAFQAECYKSKGFRMEPYQITAMRGTKFVRLVMERSGVGGEERSCYGFLDYQGNIYKSESWAKPAKHIRGSIFDENFSIGKAFNEYGVVYLR